MVSNRSTLILWAQSSPKSYVQVNVVLEPSALVSVTMDSSSIDASGQSGSGMP